MQKIDKELESALATLDKEKEEALKDLDAQVSSAWISMLTVPAVPVAVTRAYDM